MLTGGEFQRAHLGNFDERDQPLRSTRHMDELLDERLQITKLGPP